MADPQTRSRLRGRFCKKNSASRSIFMRNLNNSAKLKDNNVVEDHEYSCTFGQTERDPVLEAEIHDDDIHVAAHVTIGADDSCNANSPSWKDGRRVVELGMLAQQMYCDKCRSYLHLSDIIGERRYGLGSLLEVECRYCSWISLVSTGKRNDKGAFDINSKVALGVQIFANHENVEGVKEGSTYEARIAEDNSPDIETIPSPMDIKDKSSFVVFDLEATGLARSSDITQLSAFDGKNSFNMYVRPRQHISKEASAITGITFSFESNQMFLNGNPVECHEQHEVFISFLEYLQKKDRPILVGHNISAYDVPVLTSAFREHGLLSTLHEYVYGCIDTLHVAKRCISKSCVSNFKQETLVKTFLGTDYQYEAHKSMEDVKSLLTLFNLKLKDECCSTDIFPFNISVLNASYNAMVQRKLISKPISRKLAKSGFHFNHLQLAYKRDRIKGIRFVLSQHGFKRLTIMKFLNYFDSLEE